MNTQIFYIVTLIKIVLKTRIPIKLEYCTQRYQRNSSNFVHQLQEVHQIKTVN